MTINPAVFSIQLKSPYEGFDYTRYSLQSVPEWHGDSLILASLVENMKPELIIEVGSWKGNSAINMAKALIRCGLKDSRIICVDTWLGSCEFWWDKEGKEHYEGLALKNGYPSVYYQFLANVCLSGVKDYIIPFPQTSEIASRYFRIHKITAGIIYIDASHEYDAVYSDIKNYWNVLQPGGIMIGDDWILIEDVRKAVYQFCEDSQITPMNSGDFWVLKKNG